METFTEAVMRISRADKRLATPQAVWRRIYTQSVRELDALCAAYREIGQFGDLPIACIETALAYRPRNGDAYSVAEAVLTSVEGVCATRSWEETAMRVHSLTQQLRESLDYYRYLRQLDEL